MIGITGLLFLFAVQRTKIKHPESDLQQSTAVLITVPLPRLGTEDGLYSGGPWVVVGGDGTGRPQQAGGQGTLPSLNLPELV